MSNKPIILFAEDELSLAQIVTESLESRGFNVIHCADGQVAFENFLTQKPHLLLLDIMMPVKDGLTLAREIRKLDQQIPILFLTSKSQITDVIDGFGAGANDYLKKPFSLEELIVRIQSLLRSEFTKNDILKIGNYRFDVLKQILEFKNTSISLTFRESEILAFLVLNKNQIIDRNVILQKIWGNNDFFTGRSLDVFITKLRKKLADDPEIQIINLRGFGYKLIF